MARQGRQPKQLQQPARATATAGAAPPAAGAASSKPKPAASRKAAAKAAAKAATAATPDTALDVYTHTNRVRRARGDVDPLARARSGSGRKGKGAAATAAKGKGKGKGRALPSDDDDDEELEDGEQDDDDSDDEDEQGGFRIRGDEVVEFTGFKPAGFKLGMDSDDEARFVASDDSDEDIDSDLADDDSGDEGPLAGPSSKGGARGKKRSSSARQDKEVDLDEDEIDYDDEEGEGWMDLTEMLDAGGYPSEGGDDDDESGSGSGSGAGSDAQDDEDEDEDMSADDDDESGALDKLDSFVEGLDSKKRKARDGDDDGDGGDGTKKKKRVVLAERTEAYPEGEFVAVKNDNGKVDLDDLLASFTDSKNPRLAGLKKSLKTLAPSSSASSSAAAAKVTTTNSHLKSSGPLAAPLPGRLQDKVDREAAYDQTKDETDKWNETVRRMKGQSGLGAEGARHERLTLPLMGGEGDVRRDPNAQEWSAKFQPTNDLEASVQSLLSTAHMSQADLQQQEKAALATLDPADLAARQAELRRQRDLMYRAERKAKRVAKIKSKAYRRIHRKQRERDGAGAQLSLDDLAELDAIDGGSRVDDERTRLELQRAKERVTLKHSGKGGRWARKVDGLEGLDEERNAAIRDMVSRREELRKKIAGVGSGDDERDEFASSDEGEGDDDSMASGGDDDDDVDAVRRRAFDELAALDAKEAALKAGDPKLKGVMNMKFMRDAMSRADRDVQRDEDELRQRLAQLDEMRDDAVAAASGGEDDDGTAPVSMSEQVEGNLGRMVFGPTSAAAKLASAQSANAGSPSSAGPTLSTATTTKLSGPVTVGSSTSRTARARPSLSNPGPSSSSAATATADDPDANPWLALASADGGGAVLSRKLNKAGHGKDQSSLAKSTAKADRARAKQADAREAERDDARVELDLGADAALAATAGAGAGAGGKKGKQQAAAARTRKGDRPQVGGALAVPAQRMDGEAAESSDEELDEEEMLAQRGKGPAAFRQRELVKEAFANDDVVADFAEEKRKEVERDAPREEDNTLPGWGAWAGKGAKKQKHGRKFITKVAGVDAAKRKDAQLGHVIISEKKDKKAHKYMLKDLPFPYTSAAQHEHKLATPLGPEWSTSTILRDQTIPAVLVKPGVTIRPVDRKMA